MTKTAKTRPALTVEMFDRMSSDERWAGFGYIGGRRNALDNSDPDVPATPDLVAAADAAIIERATVPGWDEETLFEWANSKLGRWFADAAFSGDLDLALSPAWNLMRRP